MTEEEKLGPEPRKPNPTGNYFVINFYGPSLECGFKVWGSEVLVFLEEALNANGIPRDSPSKTE